MAPSLFRQDSTTAPPGAETPITPAKDSDDGQDRARRRRREHDGTISVFGAGMTVEGEVHASGDIQIEGKLKGNVSAGGQVTVTSTGVIDGDMDADRFVIAGKVNGTITASDSARLVAGCKVEADIQAPRLELEDGATLNGRIDMSGGTRPKGASRASSSSSSSSSGSASKDTNSESPEGVGAA